MCCGQEAIVFHCWKPHWVDRRAAGPCAKHTFHSRVYIPWRLHHCTVLVITNFHSGFIGHYIALKHKSNSILKMLRNSASNHSSLKICIDNPPKAKMVNKKPWIVVTFVKTFSVHCWTDSPVITKLFGWLGKTNTPCNRIIKIIEFIKLTRKLFCSCKNLLFILWNMFWNHTFT